MKKKNVIIIVVVALLLVGVICFFTLRGSGKTNYRLDTTSLAVNDISVMVTATGTVEPITQVEVGTQVSGIIDKIYVDYNSEIEKGQILAELDKTTLEADLRSKELEVLSARTEYEYQQTNFNRLKNLHNQDLISQTDYETALYNYQRAEASYNKLLSDLTKVRTNLGYATITSPIDGVVLSRAVEEGQTVAASFNTPTLFTIANDLTKMQVVADVDEADIGEVRDGQRVTFTVDAYPSDVFEGTVMQVRLEPTEESNVVTYEVLVNAPNPDLKLKPGLTANITIYTLEEKGVNTLPNKALSFRPSEEIIQNMGYILDRNGEVETKGNNRVVWVQKGQYIQPRNITIGQTDGVNTHVLSGIDSSDLVVTGVSLALKGAANSNGSSGEQSPFMPPRPGGRR